MAVPISFQHQVALFSAPPQKELDLASVSDQKKLADSLYIALLETVLEMGRKDDTSPELRAVAEKFASNICDSFNARRGVPASPLHLMLMGNFKYWPHTALEIEKAEKVGATLETFNDVVSRDNLLYKGKPKLTQEESPRCVVTQYRSAVIPRALFRILGDLSFSKFLAFGEKKPETPEELERLYKSFTFNDRIAVSTLTGKMTLNEEFVRAASLGETVSAVLGLFEQYEDGRGLFSALSEREQVASEKIAKDVREKGILPEQGDDRSEFIDLLTEPFSALSLESPSLNDKIRFLFSLDKAVFICNEGYGQTPLAKMTLALNVPISVLISGLDGEKKETTWDRYMTAAMSKRGQFQSIAELFEFLGTV